MSANQDEAEIGVSLKAAILRARVARGEKSSVSLEGNIGVARVSAGVTDGKPTVSARWERII